MAEKAAKRIEREMRETKPDPVADLAADMETERKAERRQVEAMRDQRHSPTVSMMDRFQSAGGKAGRPRQSPSRPLHWAALLRPGAAQTLCAVAYEPSAHRAHA